MEKPTIFFSHSSKDRDAILPIKEKLMKVTCGVIQIFMSSDGQSIPFGNNWVHKIEEGLNNAKIMFVFVTPMSIKSGWIYFEAGFAYSKGIDVIPVGIGVDIGSIKPPLNLLQGFNITSGESLNNFVTVINKNLNLTFEPSFSEEDFKLLDNAIEEAEFLLNFDELFGIAKYTKEKSSSSSDGEKILSDVNKIQSYLDENKIEYAYQETAQKPFRRAILVRGIKIEYEVREDLREKILWSYETLNIKFSAYSFQETFLLFQNMVKLIQSDKPITLTFRIRSEYLCVLTSETLSAIIAQNPTVFSPDKAKFSVYHYCNSTIEFCGDKVTPPLIANTEPYYTLKLNFMPSEPMENIANCIRALLDVGVIRKRNSNKR